MTVCTNDVALCNLVEHVVPVSVSNAGRDPELLVSEMIELEDDRVGLATVDAWVVAEVVHEEGKALFEQGLIPLCCGVVVALSVGPV
jgi:hypothetical protein